ncbi:MAG: DUF535 family protein [Candidatus Thiodiazotropha sp.]
MFRRASLILRSSEKITLEPDQRKAKLSPLKYGYLKGRIAYFVMASLNAKDIMFMDPVTVDRFRVLMEQHPEAIPSIFWPYQCKDWGASERVEYLYSHFATLLELPYRIDCQATQERILAEVDDVYPGLRIVIDKNGLFMREGMLTLNTYVGHERIFTLAFSLHKNASDQICALVGAIQGRRMPNIETLYRDMTRKTYGIRPRDLMVEVFQIFCYRVGIDRIYAIADSHRQHKHYFYCLKKKDCHLYLNYDEVWSDRGGIRSSAAFFELPAQPATRDLNEVISKKRSMYRNRYALLDRLSEEIGAGLEAVAGRFPEDNCLPARQPSKQTMGLT